MNDYIEPVELLLAAKFNVHHTDKTGCTALDCSSCLQSQSGHSKYCELLESWSLLTPVVMHPCWLSSFKALKRSKHCCMKAQTHRTQ